MTNLQQLKDKIEENNLKIETLKIKNSQLLFDYFKKSGIKEDTILEDIHSRNHTQYKVSIMFNKYGVRSFYYRELKDDGNKELNLADFLENMIIVK